MATQSHELLKQAHVVLVLHRGAVSACGSYAQIAELQQVRVMLGLSSAAECNSESGCSSISNIGDVPSNGVSSIVAVDSSGINNGINSSTVSDTVPLAAPGVADTVAQEAEEEREVAEYIESGRISAAVYACYCTAAGPLLSACVLLCTVCMQASSTLVALWWAHWAGRLKHYTPHTFLYATLVLVGCNVLLALLRAWVFAYAGLRAARRLYSDMTAAVFRAPLAFFETTPFGRVVNRFSKVCERL
jgi:ABC-type multidrug transport system fused ATPase/permease subunit